MGCEVPFSGEESGGEQAVCVWESKGPIMLSQEKQLANNNDWAASECRTWTPASWNDHKSRGRLGPPWAADSGMGETKQR